MRVLLTGATGFVGAQVLERLVERGDSVRVLVLPRTLGDLRHRDHIDVVEGGLEDEAALGAATRGVEVVYHLAAIHLSALRAVTDARDLKTVNVDGTARLLRACGANSVRRIVFTSSVAVYNAAPWAFMWPIHETHPLRTTGEDNLRNYALSKIEAEDLIRRAHQELGIETVVLRAAAVYGAGAAWVERTLRAIAANPLSAFSRSGTFACNQWIHRDDVARAVVIGGTAAELQHELCNVAGPELFSARDLLITMSRIRRQEPWMRVPVREPERTAPYAYRYDTTRARARLGFAPRIKLETGLGDVLQAMTPPPAFARMPRRMESPSPLAEVELF